MDTQPTPQHRHDNPSHREDATLIFPPIITPHELVSASAVRRARAGYDAARRHGAPGSHSERLATALAAAAPTITAELLDPLRSYLDGRARSHYVAAYVEHQSAGNTARYRQNRAAADAYDHAAELLAHHVATFTGDNPRHVADLTGSQQ